MEKISNLNEYDDYSSDDALDDIVNQVIIYYINFIIYNKLIHYTIYIYKYNISYIIYNIYYN